MYGTKSRRDAADDKRCLITHRNFPNRNEIIEMIEMIEI